MPEPGIRFLTFVRQRYPGLDAVHRTAVGPQLLEALGMGDTPARGHPVDLAGPDRLFGADAVAMHDLARSEEHTSELQSLMRISYAVFCLKKKKKNNIRNKLSPNNYTT